MLTIDVDVTKAVSWFDDTEERQLPYAISLALNNTAKDFQAAERTHLRDIFHLNREQWADRSIKLTHRATKGELWAEISVAPPGGSGAAKADILTKFEEDTEKTPTNGRLALAIPIDAPRTGGGVLASRTRPRNLGLQKVAVSGGFTIFRGDGGTVMLQRPDGTGVILQHDTPHVHGQRDGTLLYLLKPQVKIRPELHFQSIGEKIVDDVWEHRWDEAWERAMETAR